MAHNTRLEVRTFEVPAPGDAYRIEAVCVRCGVDLVVVVGGGSSYHVGSLALTLSLPDLKDPNRLTNSTYQVAVPGHKEEELARESSLLLSRRLQTHVVVTVGIHMDNLSKENIPPFVERFYELIDLICDSYMRE